MAIFFFFKITSLPSKVRVLFPPERIVFPFLSSTLPVPLPLPSPPKAFPATAQPLQCPVAPSVTPYGPFAIWLFRLAVTIPKNRGASKQIRPMAALVQAPQPGLREMRVLFALPGMILSSNNNKLGKGKEKGREGQSATRSLRALASKV